MQLKPEQRTQIRQQVFARSDLPRVDRVDFALGVGTLVPEHVRFAPVPEVIISSYPQYRDDEFFVVRDDIVIVDHSRKIIAVMPTGEQVGTTGTSGGQVGMAPGAAGSVSLSVEEIRQVQLVLQQKGFEIGVIDGQMGPRTMAALEKFQRQQGLQATGKFDHQTIAALGVSVKGSEGGAQPSTSGQNPSSQNPPTGAQPEQGAPRSGGTTQQAPANPSAGRQGMAPRGQPSTSGQGSEKMQQPAPSSGAPRSQNPGSSTPSGQSR